MPCSDQCKLSKTIQQYLGIQWNPTITDTTGSKDFVPYSEVSFAQGVIVDHAPLTITLEQDYGL